MTKQAGSDVADALSELLASTYTLYLKTQNYHWNVTGPMFTTLHTLFETQYTELATAVDEIAERIRSVGARAPGSFSAFSALTTVKEETGHPDAKAMIRTLVKDQGAITDVARRVIDVAEPLRDQATVDLATRRLDVHEKNAWMLRSHLD